MIDVYDKKAAPKFVGAQHVHGMDDSLPSPALTFSYSPRLWMPSGHGLEAGTPSYYASVTMKPCCKHAVLQCLCAIVGRNLLLQTFLALTITATVSDVI